MYLKWLDTCIQWRRPGGGGGAPPPQWFIYLFFFFCLSAQRPVMAMKVPLPHHENNFLEKFLKRLFPGLPQSVMARTSVARHFFNFAPPPPPKHSKHPGTAPVYTEKPAKKNWQSHWAGIHSFRCLFLKCGLNLILWFNFKKWEMSVIRPMQQLRSNKDSTHQPQKNSESAHPPGFFFSSAFLLSCGEGLCLNFLLSFLLVASVQHPL